ncbi:MAG: ABC transporter ATP-binding protein [Acidobacteria bacterium]|nr:ABC transporter ATP-binding protein [Acidobacteriota bacterium]
MIRVENLGKQYRIGARQAPYQTLRESITNAVTAPFRWRGTRNAERGTRNSEDSFWALKDVSFDVMPGEVVGIIGRNGAGKSTLLKILSRITEPTEGKASLYGRVGSLLEVGTGFHAELSGRENIRLNGAILGMKRHEIDGKFEEIVEFAEIEKFIDTPVKHFSSGMYLRLAFAVAAHLDPEILVVDEVLAVGDSSFSRKCLGKMDDVAKQGRTVLFVSHTMPAIQNLCHRAIVLSNGCIQFQGEVDRAVKFYLSGSTDTQIDAYDLTIIQNRNGSGDMRLVSFWMEDDLGTRTASVSSGDRCSMVVEYVAQDNLPRRDVFMSIRINALSGAPIALVNTNLMGQDFNTAPAKGCIRFEIPKLPLTAGRYFVDLHLATQCGHSTADFLMSAAAFDVSDGDFFGTGRSGCRLSPVLIDGGWQLDELL